MQIFHTQKHTAGFPRWICVETYTILRENSLNVLIKKNLSIFIVVVHIIKWSHVKTQSNIILSRLSYTIRIKYTLECFHCNITIITISRRPIFWHWCWRWLHTCTQNLFIIRVFMCRFVWCFRHNDAQNGYVAECKDTAAIIMAKMHALQL